MLKQAFAILLLAAVANAMLPLASPAHAGARDGTYWVPFYCKDNPGECRTSKPGSNG